MEKTNKQINNPKQKNNDQSTFHVDDPETLEKAQLCSTMLLQEGSEVGS